MYRLMTALSFLRDPPSITSCFAGFDWKTIVWYMDVSKMVVDSRDEFGVLFATLQN
jgi:hypothetical protein